MTSNMTARIARGAIQLRLLFGAVLIAGSLVPAGAAGAKASPNASPMGQLRSEGPGAHVRHPAWGHAAAAPSGRKVG